MGSDTYGRNKYTFVLTVTNKTNLSTTNITKLSSKIIALDVNTIYNQYKYLTVTLKDDLGNFLINKSLVISVNGNNSLFKTNSKGQINMETKYYNPAVYKVAINFIGDDKYISSSKTIHLNIKKQTPVLFASKKTFKVKMKIKKFKLNLKDRNNKPLKNAKISLKIKSKTYIAKTNTKGVVTFKVKLTKVGNYKTVIKFAGNKLYNSIRKTIIISVKK